MSNSATCKCLCGTIENADHLKFQSQIFIDNKPRHYSFAEKTETMTEDEVLAKYSSLND